MASNPMDEDIPMKVRKARFMYEKYYFHMRCYYVGKTLTGRIFAHRMQDGIFLPSIPMASFRDRTKAAEGQKVMKKVAGRDIPLIDAALWAKFDFFGASSARRRRTSWPRSQSFLKPAT